MEKTIHNPAYRDFLKWLRDTRESGGLTMRAVAERLNVSHSWIGKIEQAERRIDIAEFVRLCEALHVNPHSGLDVLADSLCDHAADNRKLRAVAEKRSHYKTRKR